MYDPFYWYEQELDRDYLERFGEVQSTDEFIETEMANEYNERR